MWKWLWMRGVLEILERFLQFNVKLLVDFYRSLVKLRQSSKLWITNSVEQPFGELSKELCCGVCNFLNYKNVFIYIKPSK